MARQEFERKCLWQGLGLLCRRADRGLTPTDFSEEEKVVSVAADSIVGSKEIKNAVGEGLLSSIFFSFNSAANKQDTPHNKYPLREISDEEGFVYADVMGNDSKSVSDYRELVNKLQAEVGNRSWSDFEINELLQLTERFTSLVPCEQGDDVDVSLFVRTKLRAAVGSCLQQVAGERNIADIKQYFKSGCCLSDDNFLVISGDISGIQDFIYTISSKGALKSLRGRSVYLEILMENFVDELLNALKLSRVNLLYSGGGHFYLLVGNTEKNNRVIKDLQKQCNQWFLSHYGTKLYMAMGTARCSGNDLTNMELQQNVFSVVSMEIAKDKMHRYDGEILQELFDEKGSFNRHLDSSRECSVCHSSHVKLLNDVEERIGGGPVCANCLGLYSLGEKILKEESALLVTEDNAKGDGLAIFGADGKTLTLRAVSQKEVDIFAGKVVRVYSKNKRVTSRFDDVRLWFTDYCVRDNDGGVLEFEKLAKKSTGIERLGVLRADVDNLGAAFLGGFTDFHGTKKEGESNITRYADLSNALSVFFKRAVDRICEGKLAPGQTRFYLPFRQKSGQRHVHVVYSGGDDMFFVGAWDELLELAVDIREAFRIFTGDKLTFSAGLAMFQHSFPVSKMAELAGELEEAGKSRKDERNLPAKDGIALFGPETAQIEQDTKLVCKHVYNWKTFEENVCGEKLRFFCDHVFVGDGKDLPESESHKLLLGKGQLYDLMELLDQAENGDIKLARLVYKLARMQPLARDLERKQTYEEFANKMYGWYKVKKDCRELRTAITLLVYLKRNEKKEE